MTIQMVNGYPVYAVTKKEVAYHPSYFQQQAEKWVEGSKKDKLSDEEMYFKQLFKLSSIHNAYKGYVVSISAAF